MLVSKVYKAGRSWNGFHCDRGVIIHAIEGEEPNGFWGGKSLCGTRPGNRSYGWVNTNKEVTCEKCKKKVSELLAQID